MSVNTSVAALCTAEGDAVEGVAVEKRRGDARRGTRRGSNTAATIYVQGGTAGTTFCTVLLVAWRGTSGGRRSSPFVVAGRYLGVCVCLLRWGLKETSWVRPSGFIVLLILYTMYKGAIVSCSGRILSLSVLRQGVDQSPRVRQRRSL